MVANEVQHARARMSAALILGLASFCLSQGPAKDSLADPLAQAGALLLAKGKTDQALALLAEIAQKIRDAARPTLESL
jgi:hypothetical protein